MTKHLWHDWHDVRRKVDSGHATAHDLDRERWLRQLLFGASIYRAEQAVEQARQVARQLQAQRRRPMSAAQRIARDRILRNSRR